jgi:hypothetical protein
MATTTFIKDLTETQVLSAVREMFEGEHITNIKLQPLIDQSETLEDLYIAIRRALKEKERQL